MSIVFVLILVIAVPFFVRHVRATAPERGRQVEGDKTPSNWVLWGPGIAMAMHLHRRFRNRSEESELGAAAHQGPIVATDNYMRVAVVTAALFVPFMVVAVVLFWPQTVGPDAQDDGPGELDTMVVESNIEQHFEAEVGREVTVRCDSVEWQVGEYSECHASDSAGTYSVRVLMEDANGRYSWTLTEQQ